MRPTIGRIVHFYEVLVGDRSYSGPFAALVTGVDPGGSDREVTLQVFYPAGHSIVRVNVPFEARLKAAGRYGDEFWTWPPRIG